MQPTLAVGMLFLPIFRALAAEEPGSAVAGVEVVSDANESVPPKVRILSGARTTFQDSPFVGFSCQATNPAKDVAMFVGYRADSSIRQRRKGKSRRFTSSSYYGTTNGRSTDRLVRYGH